MLRCNRDSDQERRSLSHSLARGSLLSGNTLSLPISIHLIVLQHALIKKGVVKLKICLPNKESRVQKKSSLLFDRPKDFSDPSFQILILVLYTSFYYLSK